MKEELSIFEHLLIIGIPVIFFVLVKFIRSAEQHGEEIQESRNEIQTTERQVIENHYHSHDNRVVNIYVKDGNELKTVLSKKVNQTKLLGE